jgi:hypothetical protein
MGAIATAKRIIKTHAPIPNRMPFSQVAAAWRRGSETSYPHNTV